MNLRDFALGKASGGGGGEATLINKNISANGTYNASSDSADGYKKVVVAVPQPTGNINITDTSQTNVSAYATAQVVDADLVAGNIKKDVNILGITGTYEGGGGGGSSWTLLHEEDIEVSTTSTSATLIKTISLPEAWTGDMLFIQVKDKQGPRNGYFYQTLTFIQNVNAENQTTTTYNSFFPSVISKNNDIWTVKIDRYGIYPLEVSNGGNIPIYARYNSTSSKSIDSTYTVSIYKLSLPDGTPSPFA